MRRMTHKEHVEFRAFDMKAGWQIHQPEAGLVNAARERRAHTLGWARSDGPTKVFVNI
jgi:hypothetical protein